MRNNPTTLNTPSSSTKSLVQYWEEQTKLWSDSGLSKSAYCKDRGVNYHQMIYWSKKLCAKKSVEPTQQVKSTDNTKRGGFVGVSVATTVELFLRLPSGIEIRGIQEHRLADIIELVTR